MHKTPTRKQVTGCGYPDVATRALVHMLSLRLPGAEVVGLCDYNPHGLSLLLTYRWEADYAFQR
jgi:meiotic recombination protein SPO11